MRSDYSYCSGVTCPIKKTCRRYLPDPPDIPLWWVPPGYKTKTKGCPYYEEITDDKPYMDNSEYDYGHDVDYTSHEE